MAKAQENQENHWPGFVDALSTIVMVVTFLLIILAIAIFVMSLRIVGGNPKIEATADLSLSSTNIEVAQSFKVADDPEEDAVDATELAVLQSKEAIILQFPQKTIKIDDVTKTKTISLAQENAKNFENPNYVVNAYFDPVVSYTKARRVAFYRVMSAREMLTEKGIAPERIQTFVREAPTSGRIDTIEISLNSGDK